ncbi:MAG: hypothetical protein KJ645_03195 [Planctomycetes bacterium]|nr:hypothetical protein [Planctomycetota bacterium]
MHCFLWKTALGFLGLLSLVSCRSTDAVKPRPLESAILESTEAFFSDLMVQGSMAQSYFALFLPEQTVNKRYLLQFRESLERGLRTACAAASMHYNATADRVFFLSEHRAPDWETPQGGEKSAAVLADEFRRGTPAGWTILHAFWAQYNRLLVGDSDWIQNLPESVRADLSHPLRYVVRVGVSLESSPDLATHIHRIHFALIEVGKEKAVFSGSYPLVLTFPLV